MPGAPRPRTEAAVIGHSQGHGEGRQGLGPALRQDRIGLGLRISGTDDGAQIAGQGGEERLGLKQLEDVVEDAVPLTLVHLDQAEAAQEEGAFGGEEGDPGPALGLRAGFEPL